MQDLLSLVKQDYRAALLVDAVNLFGRALERWSAATDPAMPRVSCEDGEDVWEGGEAFLEVLRNTSLAGLAGEEGRWREDGTREELGMDILRLEETGEVRKGLNGDFFTGEGGVGFEMLE